MTFGRLDDDLPARFAIARIPRSVCWLDVEALAFCNRYHTDGFVPANMLRGMTTSDNPERDMATLVELSGLWTKVKGGWQRDWTLQKDAETIEREQEQGRQRKRNYDARVREREEKHAAGDHSLCSPRYCPDAGSREPGVGEVSTPSKKRAVRNHRATHTHTANTPANTPDHASVFTPQNAVTDDDVTPLPSRAKKPVTSTKAPRKRALSNRRNAVTKTDVTAFGTASVTAFRTVPKPNRTEPYGEGEGEGSASASPPSRAKARSASPPPPNAVPRFAWKFDSGMDRYRQGQRQTKALRAAGFTTDAGIWTVATLEAFYASDAGKAFIQSEVERKADAKAKSDAEAKAKSDAEAAARQRKPAPVQPEPEPTPDEDIDLLAALDAEDSE